MKHRGEPKESWPYYFTQDGAGVLPSPACTDDGRVQCNEPYKVNGVIVGYCTILVSIGNGKHSGNHLLFW